MRKFIAIILSMLMVFAVMPIAMVSAEGTYTVWQDFETDATYATATNSNAWKTSTVTPYEGASCYRTIGKSGVWNVNNVAVSSSNFKNYVKFEIPTTSTIVGDIGFYAYKTTSNTSKFEAIGVQFEDGTMYFTKFSTGTVGKAWAQINFIGKKMYSYTDSSVSKTLTVDDFANGTNKVAYLILATAGSTSSGYETYVDNLFYTIDEGSTAYKVTIDGEQVAEVAKGETYTIPTPAEHSCYVDANGNYYYGGEVIELDRNLALTTEVEKAIVTYTMDPGSRVESAATANIAPSGEGEYVEIDGDWKLGIKVKSDQSGYFKLPSNWSNKPYFKPVSISVSYDKNVTSSVGFKSVDFSQAISGSYAPSGDKYSIFASTGGIEYTPKTYTIDITEDMYDYYYFSTKFYASASYSTTAPVYALVDNVTIIYEYDFDYVAPSIKLETLEGAQLRLNNKTGIRFTTEVDPDQIASYIEDGYTVEMGTLIAPADKLTGELTFETATKAVVPFTSFVNDNYFDGNKIAGSIVNIKEKNYGREFVGRGYIKLTKDGETTTIYSEASSTRSIKYIANACKNDTAFYESLDEEYKAKVDVWAAAPDFGA